MDKLTLIFTSATFGTVTTLNYVVNTKQVFNPGVQKVISTLKNKREGSLDIKLTFEDGYVIEDQYQCHIPQYRESEIRDGVGMLMGS